MTNAKDRLARYSLTGPEAQRAVEAGLADGDWFRSDIPRQRMKELMRRSDSPAIRDTAIWLGLMVVSGTLGGLFWGSWLPKQGPCHHQAGEGSEAAQAADRG